MLTMPHECETQTTEYVNKHIIHEYNEHFNHKNQSLKEKITAHSMLKIQYPDKQYIQPNIINSVCKFAFLTQATNHIFPPATM